MSLDLLFQNKTIRQETVLTNTDGAYVISSVHGKIDRHIYILGYDSIGL